MKNKNIRLNTNITPNKYDITLRPDLENFTFSGFETIYLNINKKTNTITLHSKDLDIETASIILKKDKIFPKDISYNTKTETITLKFKEVLEVGKYKLNLVFKGILNDKMRGFYKSSYLDEGVTKHLATTQFEATDARRSFPCFDEPEQKAIFNVSLIVKKGQHAISNTLPISVKEHESGFDVFNFAPTPKMSTYLLAFIVGDFEYLEGKSKDGVLVRVYTTKGKKSQGTFALECAIKTLEFYEKYFNIKYPLNTLDMIAIPDFASGAMENWGAITYRESALLVDEDHSSLANKQWVALVIAHELAHQWFGNLVTMRWWTHLWLNEGFASYIEYLAVDKLFPNWKIWNQFLNHDFGVALKLDALNNTHAIEIEVHHPDEIGEIFDEVSYSKGASIIRMLADYLGEDKFRDGLRYYLKKHSYKNTETEDLWEAFEKVSKKDVKNIMKNWTNKPGYPLVSASIKNNKIELSQKRFFSNILSEKNSKDKTVWNIPINYEVDGTKEQLLFSKNAYLNSEVKYIKINTNESSFFRTEYDADLLFKLKGKIISKEFSSIDRLGIVQDLFALNENGKVEINVVLRFLENYKNEEDYTVWLEIIAGLNKIEQIFSKTKNKENLDSFILNLLKNIFDKVGLIKKENEDHLTSLLRPLVLNRLAKSGNKKVITFVNQEYKKINQGLKVDPNSKSLIYQNVATYGNQKTYKDLIKLYKKESLHEEKNRIGNALGEFTDDKILCEVIHFAISENVRTQDSISILSSVALNPIGRDIWIKMLKINWQTLLNRYGDGGHSLGRLIKSISLTPEKKHKEKLTEFFKKNEVLSAKRSIAQTLEKIESNMLWLERDNKNLSQFFKTWKN